MENSHKNAQKVGLKESLKLEKFLKIFLRATFARKALPTIRDEL
jgi:hypothetical protein